MVGSMTSSEKELWSFPCEFAFKAMTVAIDGIENNVISAIQKHVPGDYTAQLKESRGGKYLSVTINLYLTDRQQLDNIYKEVHAIEGVKMLL